MSRLSVRIIATDTFVSDDHAQPTIVAVGTGPGEEHLPMLGEGRRSSIRVLSGRASRAARDVTGNMDADGLDPEAGPRSRRDGG